MYTHVDLSEDANTLRCTFFLTHRHLTSYCNIMCHEAQYLQLVIGSPKGIVILQHPVVDVGCDVTFLDSSNYKKKPTTHHLHRACFICLPLHFQLVMTFAPWNISRTDVVFVKFLGPKHSSLIYATSPTTHLQARCFRSSISPMLSPPDPLYRWPKWWKLFRPPVTNAHVLSQKAESE